MDRPPGFRVLSWTFAVVLFVFALVPVLHAVRGHSIKDYLVWYETGQHLLEGGEIYPVESRKFPFMYPPPCALFLAPVSALGKTGLVAALVLVNAAAWVASIVFSVYLATGKRRAHLFLYLIPNLAIAGFVWGNFLLGQPSLVLLALLLGGFIALQRKRPILAGILIALAAAIKAFPVLVLIYLVYRRYWTAAATLVLALAFLLIIAPIPFRGFELAKQDLESWSNGMLFKYDEAGVGQRLGRSNSWKNQSIWGVSNRLLRHVEYDHRYEPHTPVYADLVDMKFATVNAIILGAALLIGLGFIAVMPGAAARTSEKDAIEFALLLLLILIFTPLSFGYLFAWLLYPITVVVQRFLAGPAARTALPACAIVAAILLVLLLPARVMAQTYGSILFATLLLFIGLALELWRLKRARPSPGNPTSIF
ncbi:MAG: hypothetical protein QOK24_1842 [Verrucomicrobiota bacterium]|jgi:hypothetical protein